MNNFKLVSFLSIFFIFLISLPSCKDDPCEDRVCLNGGECLDGSCICPQGFTGEFCQDTVDPCAGITCLNGGGCVDGSCLCPQGFTGEFCQTPQDPCIGVSCQNGGFCDSGICNCPPGYFGVNCELMQDPCQGISCQNGGSCQNGNCQCPPGYTGTFCETQMTPTSMRIVQIRVDGFPASDNGAGWDLASSFPDIYIAINAGQSANTDEFTTGYIDECVPGNSYTFTSGFPVTLNNLNTSYTFSLWDYDSTSSDDSMGGYYTTPANYTNGLPSSFRLYSSGNPIDIRVFVEWNF